MPRSHTVNRWGIRGLDRRLHGHKEFQFILVVEINGAGGSCTGNNQAELTRPHVSRFGGPSSVRGR